MAKKESTVKTQQKSSHAGIVLTGGGARGAYQAGVLKALADIRTKTNTKLVDPFRILSGFSSGAINTSFLATNSSDVDHGAERLYNLWSNLTSNNIYQTNAWSILKNSIGLLSTMILGKELPLVGKSFSLLNTNPLNKLLGKHIDCLQIQRNIDQNLMDCLTVTATDFSGSLNVTFVQDRDKRIKWRRKSRMGIPSQINQTHVLASSAIPFFFPSISIGGRYFGDGSIRNTAPVSPAIHCGADRLFIVGVKKKKFSSSKRSEEREKPSHVGLILNTLLNSIFLDSIEMDVERLSRINNTLEILGSEKDKSDLKPIDFIYIQPTVDLAEIAREEFKSLPRFIRFLLMRLGSQKEIKDVISYILFEPSYCIRLLELGYQDCMARQDEIVEMLRSR